MLLRTSAVDRCERGITYVIRALSSRISWQTSVRRPPARHQQVDLRLAAALGWVSDSDICLAAQMSLAISSDGVGNDGLSIVEAIGPVVAMVMMESGRTP